MSIAADVVIIILLFTLFGFVHSLLASHRIKLLFKKTFNDLIAFYRLLYNLFSLATFYFIYELSPKPNIIIYDLLYPYDFIVLIPQAFSLAGIFWAFRYICFKEFLGISQLKRFLDKNYNNELDEELTLQIRGPYRFSRHPVYFFSITFLLFRPTMDLFYLTFFCCIVIYFYIGSYYEEKKLVLAFGEDYLQYQKSVSRIIPFNLLKPYREKN